MSQLFSTVRLRDLEIRNRVWVSPMCQYSSVDGLPDDWHLVHLGGLARGGAGLVVTEAAAVVPEGRITPQDAGIWDDAQAAAWSRIVAFVHAQGARAAVQLAHAGRKASAAAPWRGRGAVPDDEGGWQPVAPSAVPFPGLRQDPRELSTGEIDAVVSAFAAAATRAVHAGFDAVELHAAHGYLLHEFLSPLSNLRQDGYGGSFDRRVRLLLETVDAVRAAVPVGLPLLVRISATDWTEGGWDLEDSVRLSRLLGEHGVDLVDVSSGGNVADARIEVGPGYQVDFARRIREATGVPTGAVGMITEPKQAEEVLTSGGADVVLLARAVLRDPHWPLRAAYELGEPDAADWPVQYARARLG